MAQGEPVSSGLRGRCGTCGEGRLFGRYLTFKDSCDHCGQDFTIADTADGPAFFVGFFILIVFAPFMFLLPIADVSMTLKIVGLAVTMALAIGATLWLLPIAKGIFFNLQIHHNSGQREHRSGE